MINIIVFIAKKRKHSPYVFLDINLITDTNKYESRVQSTLDSIRKSIIIENKNYAIRGIINYVSYGNSKETLNEEHYTIIAFSGIH